MNIPGFTTIKSKKKNKLFVFKRSLNPIFEFNSGQSLYHISIERRSRFVSHIYKQFMRTTNYVLSMRNHLKKKQFIIIQQHSRRVSTLI